MEDFGVFKTGAKNTENFPVFKTGAKNAGDFLIFLKQAQKYGKISKFFEIRAVKAGGVDRLADGGNGAKR